MSPGLSAFQALCHEYYTCYVFAADGMEKHVATLPIDLQKYPNQKIYIGHTHPNEDNAQSVISAAKAAASAKRDGDFSDIIAKALLIRMYAEWDERYRHQIAEEFTVEAKCVRSNLMGDLRHVRHWIVHGKSVVGASVTKICVLPWKLADGDALRVTSAMFREFADCVNSMQVEVDT